MDQYIGKMLDNRYEILERIGTGGMAVVYKAKCHRLNRLVAVKILKSDLAQDEDFRRRFNAESQAVAQLSHPNIVSVYDVSRGGDTEYIVMELIDGITLKQYMEKRGRLNWRESLHFITQIMRGLSHAHSRGIVHRDIKPQNVMVLRDGSVKVADFGIACLENAAQTLTQEALGSVHYISPEQARGDRIDARSDIYSAGVVLYEMLTGRLPFEGDSAVSVAIQHLSSVPLAPREIDPDIPEPLELICMKAMAPDLDRRYPSADAMIADLEAFRKNPGVDLDFELSDLRPEENDEPTMLLRTPNGHRGQGTERERRYESDRRDRYESDRRDRYEEDRRPRRRASGGRIALIGVGAVAAVAVVFFLFRAIFSSFLQPSTDTYYVVPNVVGYTVEEARALDQVADGTFKIVERGSEASDEEPGLIIRQDPEKDDQEKGETPITIEVWTSAGEDVGAMIDVTDMTYAEAKVALDDLIKQYDLTLEIAEEQASEEVEESKIISSDPAEGEALHKGDTIKLVISKGMPMVPLINFVNSDLNWALAQLGTLGLEQGEITYEPSDTVEAGKIISTDPSTSEVPKGTKINFVVSEGPSGGGTAGEMGTDMLTFPLPATTGTAHLQIIVSNQPLVDQDINYADWNGTYMLEVSGTGTADAEVYIDGNHYGTYPLEFTNG
ncbi:Stk1 family PASTA domain-containing Ser/Thr kinase [Dysosmobacter sp.]|uniref:Stk1 family PASTA domain-containing Ser/Thr kinase n=1 Tax=Dysosmobacter sp. TaxID=2591382 RepID=UPI003A8F2A57